MIAESVQRRRRSAHIAGARATFLQRVRRSPLRSLCPSRQPTASDAGRSATLTVGRPHFPRHGRSHPPRCRRRHWRHQGHSWCHGRYLFCGLHRLGVCSAWACHRPRQHRPRPVLSGLHLQSCPPWLTISMCSGQDRRRRHQVDRRRRHQVFGLEQSRRLHQCWELSRRLRRCQCLDRSRRLHQCRGRLRHPLRT